MLQLNTTIIDDAGAGRRRGTNERRSRDDEPGMTPAADAPIGHREHGAAFASVAANEKGEAEAPPFHNLGPIRNYWITRVVLWLKLTP